MNTQLALAIIQTVGPLLPRVFDLLVALAENINCAAPGQPRTAADVMDVASSLTREIAAAHPDWDGETKQRYALDALRQYCVNLSLPVSESVLRTLIELAVQQLKAEAK